jgi:hypothetical protein
LGPILSTIKVQYIYVWNLNFMYGTPNHVWIFYIIPRTENWECWRIPINLGPLHVRAKSHDHDIVRAQKKRCPKVVPRHLQNHVAWSRILKCSVKSMWPGPQPIAISMNFYSCGFSHMIKYNWINQRLWTFKVPWSPGFVLNLPPWSHDHETWSIQCHVGIRVDFTSILHSHTPKVPRA